jgi:hypothetical protein
MAFSRLIRPGLKMPTWLHIIALASLSLGFLCATVIAADLFRHPQRMWIMDVVWPITALFGTVWILWQYFTYGRLAESGRQDGEGRSPTEKTPFPVLVANGTLHCGSGCTLGDIAAEMLVLGIPAVAVWFGWRGIFDEKIFAAWIVDYIFAYLFGIVFQYFTIAPMRGLSFGKGMMAAVKADTASLTAWQVGMYGFMALAHFYIFGELIAVELSAATPEFWFMMQIAMICGFATSYPVNWWLIRRGIKEKM